MMLILFLDLLCSRIQAGLSAAFWVFTALSPVLAAGCYFSNNLGIGYTLYIAPALAVLSLVMLVAEWLFATPR